MSDPYLGDQLTPGDVFALTIILAAGLVIGGIAGYALCFIIECL